MKKTLMILVVCLLATLILVGCGKSESTTLGGDVSIESLKSIAEIKALNPENTQWATGEGDGFLLYVFEKDGQYYRVKASLSKEQEEALFNIDYSDEDYEEQQNAIIDSLEILEVENLNDQILTKEECDALVGKTGKDLFDDGWTYSGHNLENMEFWMGKGPFTYTVVFDGHVDESEYETFDGETGILDLKIKSVEFSSLGDALN